MEPVGLLGGSFDPIHNGHLQLARDALKHLPLAEVRFLPAAQPWQKGVITAAEHRAHMVQLAIAGDSRFALDMREIERGGITYTIDTLRAVRSQLPRSPLVLIMGSDQFGRLNTWHDWAQVVELAHIAVAARAGAQPQSSETMQTMLARKRNDAASLTSELSGNIVEFEMTPVNVSATEVRRLLRQPDSTERAQRLSAMVPDAVL
ncbi:MAG TPA: nicotinate (nicotinamide) nucleotide adenylyltransferase, partial [Burkholderiaceae bacterium]|nr:nicotinate (nicotinamide) nucleotide adenylyltransferase [Burkholderiaceae bacterium]